MSTITVSPASGPEVADVVRVKDVTFTKVVRSEWIKLRSLRFTALTLGAAVGHDGRLGPARGRCPRSPSGHR